MKKISLAGVVLIIVQFAASSLMAVPLLDEPVDLTLKDGRVLHAAQAKSFTASTVMVKATEGVQTIAYDQFPDEYRPALETKRPAKRTDAQIQADREKARKNQPPAPPSPAKKRSTGPVDQDLYFGLRIDSYQAKGNLVEVTIFNTNEMPEGIRPSRLLAHLSSEEIVRGADFVMLDSSGNVTTILRSNQIIPANSSATYTVIFGRAMKGGTVVKVDWYR